MLGAKNEKLKELIRSIPDNEIFSFISTLTDEDLHSIAQDFDLLNSIKNQAAIMAIFYRVRRSRIVTPPLSPVDAYYFTARAGHILGLSKDVIIDAPDAQIQLKVGGNYTEVSLRWLGGLLSQYIVSEHVKEKPEDLYFRQIKEAITLAEALLVSGTNQYVDDAQEDYYSEYQDGRLIYIASGWSKDTSAHAVGVAIYGDYLVYCNRGDNTLDEMRGTRIYKIEDKNKINPEFIKQLMLENNKNADDLHGKLKEIVNFETPVITYPAKSQEHETCSFANPKATCEALLALCAMHASGYQDDAHLQEISQQQNREEYKKFVRYTLEQEVKEIVKFANQVTTSEMKTFFAELVKNIILEHHGQQQTRSDTKKSEEQERAIVLLQGMPVEIRELIINSSEVKNLLSTCAQQGNLTAVKQLIEMGVDCNSKNSFGISALHSAAMNGHHEVLTELIKGGATVDLNVLAVAIHKGKIKVVEELLKEKMELVTQQFTSESKHAFIDEEKTPLMLAEAIGKNQIADLIKEKEEELKQRKQSSAPLPYKPNAALLDLAKLKKLDETKFESETAKMPLPSSATSHDVTSEKISSSTVRQNYTPGLEKQRQKESMDVKDIDSSAPAIKRPKL